MTHLTPAHITLLDGTEGAGTSREAHLTISHRISFLVAVSGLGGGTFTLEGSNDGVNYLPLSPVGEAGTDIILEGFCRYTHIPPLVRAVTTVAGAVITGSPA